jgi:hypothetical protein
MGFDASADPTTQRRQSASRYLIVTWSFGRRRIAVFTACRPGCPLYFTTADRYVNGSAAAYCSALAHR